MLVEGTRKGSARLSWRKGDLQKRNRTQVERFTKLQIANCKLQKRNRTQVERFTKLQITNCKSGTGPRWSTSQSHHRGGGGHNLQSHHQDDLSQLDQRISSLSKPKYIAQNLVPDIQDDSLNQKQKQEDITGMHIVALVN